MASNGSWDPPTEPPMYETFEQWRSEWVAARSSPVAALDLFTRACLHLERDPDLARAVLAMMVRKDVTVLDPSSPSGRLPGSEFEFYITQMTREPAIARSHLGGLPEDDYAVDPADAHIRAIEVEQSGNKAAVFMHCGGRVAPTPVWLRRNKKGRWRVITGISAMCRGIRPGGGR